MTAMQQWAGPATPASSVTGSNWPPRWQPSPAGGTSWHGAPPPARARSRCERSASTPGGSRIGPELVLNDAPAYGSPGLVALADGGFLATWDSSPSTAPTDYIGRRFAADGAPLGASFRANDTTNGDPSAVSVEPTALAGGGFVMHWWANAGAPTWWGPVLQVYDAGIRFNGASVIIDPAANLLPGTNYQLVVAPGAIEDLAGNAYAGLSGYAFTTAGQPPVGGDPGTPVPVDFFPPGAP